MNCKFCNANNNADSKFCIKCGKPLQSSTKLCPQGHIYDSGLDKCPYCPSQTVKAIIGNAAFGGETETFATGSKTKIMSSDAKSKKTMIVGGNGDEISSPTAGRKLVAWLVTYTWKSEGEDFRIYEGRNRISGDKKDDIFINDPAVSTPHCMILYRNGKFLVKDELSTNGTYINNELIEETELNDGDIIKTGKTEFKLRTVN